MWQRHSTWAQSTEMIMHYIGKWHFFFSFSLRLLIRSAKKHTTTRLKKENESRTSFFVRKAGIYIYFSANKQNSHEKESEESESHSSSSSSSSFLLLILSDDRSSTMALSSTDLVAIYTLLENALSQDDSLRKPAEAAMVSCECRPGFCSILLVSNI